MQFANGETLTGGLLIVDARGNEGSQQSAHRLQGLGALVDAQILLRRRALVQQKRVVLAGLLDLRSRDFARP